MREGERDSGEGKGESKGGEERERAITHPPHPQASTSPDTHSTQYSPPLKKKREEMEIISIKMDKHVGKQWTYESHCWRARSQ